MRSPLLALIFLALWIGACAGLDRLARPAASDEERRALAEALSTADDNPDVAVESLKEFLNAWPRSPLADDAAMELAALELDQGDRDAALERYYFVIREHGGGDRGGAARVRAAALEIERGRTGDAARLMGRVRIDRLPPDDRLLAYRVLADVHSDPVERLHWLSRLRAVESDLDSVALIDVEIDEILQSLDARELGRAARRIDAEVPAARIQMLVAERALDVGEAREAREALERAENLPMPPQYASRLRASRERLRLREEGPPDLSDLPTFAEMSSREPPSTWAFSAAVPSRWPTPEAGRACAW